MSDFSRRLGETLQKLDLSAAEASRQTGISPATWSRLLAGKLTPGPKTLRRIAAGLHLQEADVELLTQAAAQNSERVSDLRTLGFVQNVIKDLHEEPTEEFQFFRNLVAAVRPVATDTRVTHVVFSAQSVLVDFSNQRRVRLSLEGARLIARDERGEPVTPQGIEVTHAEVE